MAPTNFYFQQGLAIGRRSEQTLMEDLTIECLRIYGFDLYYLPRTAVNLDKIFTEDPLNKYTNSYAIEGYLENPQGFEGDRDLLTKFGVEIQSKVTFVIARRRWSELIGRTGNAALAERPAEGDIIYFPLTQSFFEIKRAELHDPFYQVGKLYVYKLQCELIQASSETIQTGVEEIDDLFAEKSMDITDYMIQTEDGDMVLLETESRSGIVDESFDIDTIDGQSQNDVFSDNLSDILDFSESNPFGDIRE